MSEIICLTRENYLDIFDIHLKEEAAAIRDYIMKSAIIKNNGLNYEVSIRGLKQPDRIISIKDSLILTKLDDHSTLEAYVVEVNGDVVGFRRIDSRPIDCEAIYDIRIEPKTSPLDSYFSVLLSIRTNIDLSRGPNPSSKLKKYLDYIFGIIFPSAVKREETSSGSGEEIFKFNRFDDKLNEMQLRAVSNILAEKCKPAPYLLFGPRKTGRSKVILEAVLQLYKMYPNKKILVCATTNPVADKLAYKIKLSGVLAKEEIETDLVRLVGYDRMNRNLIPENIKDITKTSSRLSSYHRIIVTTCLESAALDYRHSFDYIFIYETTRSIEPETLIPINLGIDHPRLQNSFVVFAGDLEQPAPILESTVAKRTGLAISMMERLSKFSMYQKKGEGSEMKYDERYITKLTK